MSETASERKIRFENDYAEGAHPAILAALQRSNLEQTAGYGLDEHCAHAAQLLRRECQAPDAAVHFLVGGTQANAAVIAAALRPYEGVLSPDTGHIASHETGAVESYGHKVLTLPGKAGKLSAAQVRRAVLDHRADPAYEHIVRPGMVYISQPTEYGTLYSLDELSELYAACRELELPLYIDGARLGCAVAADPAMSLAAVARCCDAFTVGGTKGGLLFGEAVILLSERVRENFRYIMKQHGAMLAKGRLLGVQYEAAFEDGLYYRMACHAVDQAMRIRAAFAARGLPSLIDSPTNQQFPILSREQISRLEARYAFQFWERTDGEHAAVRFVTSWATRPEQTEALVRDIERL